MGLLSKALRSIGGMTKADIEKAARQASFARTEEILAGSRRPEARGMTPTRMGVPNAEKFSLDDLKFGGGSALDMSQEARMARAREMGFDVDTPLYHGTDQDINAFRATDGWYGRGVYTSRSPEQASYYSRRTAQQARGGPDIAPNVMPLFARGRLAPYEEFSALNSKTAGPLEMTNPRVQEELQRRGYDGVDVGGPDQEVVIFDPKNIRSRFAAFDPSKKDSPDLLAMLALASLAGGGGLLSRAQRERQYASY